MCAAILFCLLAAFSGLSAAADFVSTGPLVTRISELSGEKLTGLKGIIQDSAGFMWLATNKGLIRFDGQSIKRFEHQVDDPKSLPHNDIRGIVEDDGGFLWLITKGGGLSRFNLQTQQFTNFRFEQDNLQSLDSDQLNSLSLGADNLLWIGSNKGINRFERDTLKNTRLNARMKPQQADDNDNIQVIYEDVQGRLWFSVRRKGLSLYAPDKGQLQHFEHHSEQPDTLDDNTVSEIYQSRDGTVWIGTASGINRFDEQSRNFTTLAVPINPNNKARHASVTRLFEDTAGTLWVGTFYNGVSRLPEGSGRLFMLNQGSASIDNFNALHINDILQDSSGTLWFVTPRSGLIKIKPEHLVFEHVEIRAKSGISINDMAIDEHGQLWLATNQGSYIQPQKNASFARASTGPFAVTSMVFWTGKGMLVYSPAQGLILQGMDGKTADIAALDEPVVDLAVDTQGNLYAATEKGVHRYDTVKRQWSLLARREGIKSIVIAGTSVLVHGKDMPFARFDMLSSQWREIAGIGLLNALYVDSNEQVWLADQIKGLFKLDTATLQLHQQAGTESFNVMSIIEGRQGRLWLATSQGLVSYEPTRQDLYLIDQSQGLRTNTAELKMSQVAASGELVMAGKTSLLRFNPAKLQQSNRDDAGQGQILLSNFKLFNQIVLPQAQDPQSPLLTTIDKTQTLILNYQQNWFSIDFASSDYRHAEKLKYSYKMEGLSEQWFETDSDVRSASFTSVSPGKYRLFFRVSDPQDQVKQNIRSLNIVITPPWWQSSLAYGLYLFSAVALVYLFNFVRTRQLRSRAAKLELAIAQRTLELKQRADTIAQLLADKEALIANISHEFRTPLTLILGPLQSQLERSDDERSQALLSLAQANGNRLLNMVDQLLDMARMKDRPKEQAQVINASHTCQVLLAQFDTLAKQHNIQLCSVENTDAPLYVRMLPDALEKILSNLLSNAVKYGGDDGCITLKLMRRSERAVLSITDTGEGISDDDQKRIFERFSRLKNHQGFVPGAGIGLALVKDLVEQHKGCIYVESELNVGTTFTVELPLVSVCDVSGEVPSEVNASLLEAAAAQIKVNERPQLAVEEQTVDSQVNILVVEDNPDMRHYIISCLQPDYHCLEAEDGEKGLALAKQRLPDLVLSDVMMPNMDGFELTRRLKSDGASSHIPVILLTARGDSQSRLRGWSERADEYLEKPFNSKELLARIENLLSVRALLREQFSRQFNHSVTVHCDETCEHQPTDDNEKLPVENAVHRAFLTQVQQALEQHYQNEQFDVATLATELALSHRQLGRKMKTLLDMTPAEALRNFRLQKAAELLSEGTTPSVVSHRCGFSTHSYFSQCFKAKYQCSPSEYLKKPQNQPPHLTV